MKISSIELVLIIVFIAFISTYIGYNYAYNSIRTETVIADSWMNMDGRCTDCVDVCLEWEEEMRIYKASLNN